MIGLDILLTALLSMPVAEEDSIRTERLDEVVVTSTSARQRLQNVQTGAEVLQLEDLTSAPQLFGEADIMRSIQLLPGVKAESDASSSFQVRGGTSAQNQVLFDMAPVYNVGHLGGLFSAFNDDALASATLYKGLLPAQYGGASSAVLDISGRTGDKSRWHGGASIGILSAKGSIEGPLVKDKMSFLLTARRTYMDMFLKASKDFKDNTLYFFDVNAKLDWTMGRRDQLFLTFFTSHDKTAVKKMTDIRWNNMTANLKWLHHFNGDSYAQTTAFYSNYLTDNGVDFLQFNLWYKGHIRQMSLRQDFSISPSSSSLLLKAGLQTSLYNVKSAEWQVLNKYNNEQRRAWENTVWVNGTYRFGDHLEASAGLRLNAFSPLGGSLYYEAVFRDYGVVRPAFWLNLYAADEKGGDTTVKIHGIVYYNTKKVIPVEPEESAIVNEELPINGSMTDKKITAYAFINDEQSGDILVCLIDGEWYQFLAIERAGRP